MTRDREPRSVVMAGVQRCALLVPAALPSEALVLYEGPWQAPLAPRDFGPRGDPFKRVDFVRQLSIRHDGEEELIAYEESIPPKEAHLEWPGGILIAPRSMRGQSGWMWPDTEKFFYRELHFEAAGSP